MDFKKEVVAILLIISAFVLTGVIGSIVINIFSSN